MTEPQLYDLGNLTLEHGEVLHGAQLAYATYGSLRSDGSNAVVLASAYGGTHVDSEWLIGPGKALDPARWFIVATNLFGNGLSTSPSTYAGAVYPNVSVYDNVCAQQQLLVEHLGVEKIALVSGFSMGAQQTFQWAAAFPELVERIVPVCGSARTSPHNRVFIDGAVAALENAGPATLGRVWAAWGLSQAFYRNELWRGLPDSNATTLEEFVDERYGPDAFGGDARDLRAMFWTWRNADISARAPFNGDFAAALRSIHAQALVMPCRTDTYFPPEDSEIEVHSLPHGELRVIPSDWGHAGGAGANPVDAAFVSEAIRSFIDKPVA